MLTVCVGGRGVGGGWRGREWRKEGGELEDEDEDQDKNENEVNEECEGE